VVALVCDAAGRAFSGYGSAANVRRWQAWARARCAITSVLTDVFADGPSPRFWASLGLEVVGEYLDEVLPGARMLRLGAWVAHVRDPV
jgi:hypothetical protein